MLASFANEMRQVNQSSCVKMFSALSKILLFALTAAASKTNSETKKELISGDNQKRPGRKNMQMKLKNMARTGEMAGRGRISGHLGPPEHRDKAGKLPE